MTLTDPEHILLFHQIQTLHCLPSSEDMVIVKVADKEGEITTDREMFLICTLGKILFQGQNP